MNATRYRSGAGWGARVGLGVALLLAGAAAATWTLAHYQPAARLLGVAPPASQAGPVRLIQPQPAAVAVTAQPLQSDDEQKIADLEQRLARVESATQRAQGSAGRADALVVTFAARRAIDRGVALGYLEPLLASRFGPDHQPAVATVITAAHQPVRLNDLITEYEALGPNLRSGAPTGGWWAKFKSGLGNLIEIHRAGRPATNPDARYARALQLLSGGDVDDALAETMRLPGAPAAAAWTDKARRYVTVHRALDELESAALMGGAGTQG
ncbi:hypothetical protein [Sphingomonas sp.]|uniref:hypothetical protein n=1 Tax=Sphingomonas sp. TaxID=28214 RepID=UPI0025E3B70E|nr:hypothetical protein [Sphingomonas sp.]MBV9527293.1 hypothetical protein [Sphingomonas sp.]